MMNILISILTPSQPDALLRVPIFSTGRNVTMRHPAFSINSRRLIDDFNTCLTSKYMVARKPEPEISYKA